MAENFWLENAMSKLPRVSTTPMKISPMNLLVSKVQSLLSGQGSRLIVEMSLLLDSSAIRKRSRSMTISCLSLVTKKMPMTKLSVSISTISMWLMVLCFSAPNLMSWLDRNSSQKGCLSLTASLRAPFTQSHSKVSWMIKLKPEEWSWLFLTLASQTGVLKISSMNNRLIWLSVAKLWDLLHNNSMQLSDLIPHQRYLGQDSLEAWLGLRAGNSRLHLILTKCPILILFDLTSPFFIEWSNAMKHFLK